MKILHSSDWHIGRALYGRKRHEEFEAFQSWLIETINLQKVKVLLIAGDIFDTSTPGNHSQELYYRFLYNIASSCCNHVIVIAGNHDSPSFLNAPRELLRVLNVHVIGSVTEFSEDEVLVLNNREGIPELIVCAVPYLRDRDIRLAEPGESIEAKECKLTEGIQQHYFDVCNLAEQKRKKLNLEIPIIAMGHLFAAGGQTVDGDGVRELYVGSLAHVTAGCFPECIDYLALGHLHVPQIVNGSNILRYSGSPLTIGFGEAAQEKSVCLVEFAGRNASVSLVKVPVFQQLKSIRGTWDEIACQIDELSAVQSKAWLEIIYQGEEVISDLRERLDTAISGTEMEILRVKNSRIIDRVLNQTYKDETLDDLSVNDVFDRCLDLHDVPLEQRPELLRAYQETVTSLYENGSQLGTVEA